MLSVSMPTAVALRPLRHRRRITAIAVLVAATLVVVVATAVAAVAVAPYIPWLKSTPVLAAGARMGGVPPCLLPPQPIDCARHGVRKSSLSSSPTLNPVNDHHAPSTTPSPHPCCGGGIGGVGHTTIRLANIIRRIAESPLPFVTVFIVKLLAPLRKNSLIVRRHSGQKESKVGSGSVVWCFFSLSLKEDLRTLPPIEIGTFSTYLHTHMPKINSSPVKILKSSWKVPGKFSKLGLKKFSIVRSVVVL